LDAAIHLYERVGFTLTEEKESTSFGKALREQRYELMLSKKRYECRFMTY
jgi:peptidyl-dipeptidase Dcp